MEVSRANKYDFLLHFFASLSTLRTEKLFWSQKRNEKKWNEKEKKRKRNEEKDKKTEKKKKKRRKEKKSEVKKTVKERTGFSGDIMILN